MLKRLFGRGGEGGSPAPSSVDSSSGIEAILDDLAHGHDTYAIFTSDRVRNTYVQVSAGRHGLVAEAVSNAYLKPDAKLTSGDEAALSSLGFQIDETGGNWSVTFADWPTSGSAAVAELLADTLTKVYGWQPGRPLDVEMGA